eukprot:396383-Pyramimonas_sp.AAC.1
MRTDPDTHSQQSDDAMEPRPPPRPCSWRRRCIQRFRRRGLHARDAALTLLTGATISRTAIGVFDTG